MDVEQSADGTLRVEGPNHDLQIEELDYDGDVILVVEGECPDTIAKFLVSSKVLRLASPVFGALFSRNFAEGGQMIEDVRPEIMLRGDDPASMRKILKILHFKEPGDEMDANMIARFVILCDKYNCVKPLRPWIKDWITSMESIEAPSDYGFLLLAAHFARMPELFSSTSLKALKDITPDALLA